MTPDRPAPPERPDGVEPPAWRVPDADAATRCPYCTRPFRVERARDLHVGEAHAAAATADERARYEDAVEAETDELFRLHLKVVFALGAVYAALVVLAVVGFSVAG